MKTTRKYIDLSIDSLNINEIYNLPSVDGTYGQILTTDGVGNVTWKNIGSLTIISDDVIEGTTNLYFTNERVDDRVSALIQNGTGLTWTYVDSSNTLTGNVSLSPFNTGQLSEGSNLYFTNERVDDRVAILIKNGTGILWAYNDSLGTLTPTITLSPFDTDDLSEGSTNLYFKNEYVDDRVAVLIKNGTGLTWTYNDPANTLTGNVSLSPFNTGNLSEGSNLYYTDERVDDRVAAFIQDSATITWMYNDLLGTLTADAVASSIKVEYNENLISTRNTINLIPGTNISISVADDGINERANITINNTLPMTIGTVYAVQADGIQIGDSNIEILNFSDNFSITEGPDKRINIDLYGLSLNISIEELVDVSVFSPLATGDILMYNMDLGTWENIPISSIESLMSHNDLLDLQGGQIDEYYHLTSAQHIDLTDGGDTSLHYHVADRARANHTGTQTASTISDFDTEVSNNTDVDANTTHRTSNGTDHAFINQNVTNISSPTFAGLTLTGFNGVVQAVAGVLSANSLIADGTTAITQISGDNSTKLATTAYVDAAITSVDEHNELSGIQGGGGSPGEYYHLSELDYLDLTDGGDTSLHYHSSDRSRTNHIGTQLASTISDFDTEVENNTEVSANTAVRHTHSNKSILDLLDEAGSPEYLTYNGAELAYLTDIPSLTTYIQGPTSSTNNAVSRFDGITGKVLKNSGIIIGDDDSVYVPGDVTIGGTLNYENAVELQVEDKIIGLAVVGSPQTGSDITADGGGIVLYGDTNKEILWNIATNAWEMNVNLDVDGNITLNGTVDGVDIATLKTNYDNHVANSNIHFTESSIDHNSISGLQGGGGSPGNYYHLTEGEYDDLIELISGENQLLSWEWSAARNGIYTADADLRRQDGTPTNLSPYVVPVNCELIAISASCDGNETWDAEVWVNDSEVAQTSLNNTDNAYTIVSSVTLNAGDKVRLRFKLGSSGGVNNPAMSVFFKETV